MAIARQRNGRRVDGGKAKGATLFQEHIARKGIRAAIMSASRHRDASMMATTVRAGRLATAVALALVGHHGVQAATLTVDTQSDDPASTYCTLRDALQAINAGSTSGVPTCSTAASGEAFGSNDTIDFVPDSGISLIGLAQGPLEVTASSVSISGTMLTIDAGGYSPVLLVHDGASLHASGLMLTGGYNTDNGGAVSVGAGATAVFSDCTIYGNSTTGAGGAIYASAASTLTLVNSILRNNSAMSGGALAASGSAISATDSQFYANSASTRGGGIDAMSGSLTLATSSIHGNTAQSGGGGLDLANGSLTMMQSVVSGNDGEDTGGIRLYASVATIIASTISGNGAACNAHCGGGLNLQLSSLVVTDSTLSGNLAAGDASYLAGGAFVFRSMASFANSTISGNVGAGKKQVAGAFWELDSGFGYRGLTLSSSTVSSNTAAATQDTPAGGVLLGTKYFSPQPPTYGTLTLENAIVSANLPADSDILYGPFTTVVSSAYSLLGSAQNIPLFNDVANHNIFSDAPGLGPLQDNGGPTLTRALLPGSPALRSGSPALLAGQLNFDQRGAGYPRTFGGTVDIGAFEDQGDRVFFAGFESAP
jgi:hypothetical protein